MAIVCYIDSLLCHSLSFMSKMVYVGAKRPLTSKDLGQSFPGNDPKMLYDKFNVHYKKQNSKPKEKRSFFGPLCKATGFSNWYSPPLFS